MFIFNVFLICCMDKNLSVGGPPRADNLVTVSVKTAANLHIEGDLEP